MDHMMSTRYWLGRGRWGDPTLDAVYKLPRFPDGTKNPNRKYRDSMGSINCDPEMTATTKKWGVGVNDGQCKGANPRTCVKRSHNIVRMYDNNGSKYNGRWLVQCGTWKVVSCVRDGKE